MKRLHKIALSVVAMVAVGIGFGGCGDDGKSPLMEAKIFSSIDTRYFFSSNSCMAMQSRNDDTIIKNMTIKGRNGKCDIKNLGAGGSKRNTACGNYPLLKYGEQISYGDSRVVDNIQERCPPKNGKYEVELDTNFGTYYYEIEMANI